MHTVTVMHVSAGICTALLYSVFYWRDIEYLEPSVCPAWSIGWRLLSIITVVLLHEKPQTAFQCIQKVKERRKYDASVQEIVSRSATI